MPAGPVPTAMPNSMVGAPGGLKSEEPITFLNWLGMYAILLVPFVGWLIFIIMLFIWAFSNNTPATKKNWARVTLIFVGALLILFFIYMVAFVAPMMQQMMNGTFDINSYYEGLSQGIQ
jgi:glucan phosphoethanolaminetransferase (alkaline phosphatase superfamily)